MRAASGNVVSGDWLVNAVYLILRDHMPAGVVEEAVTRTEFLSSPSAERIAEFERSLTPEAIATFDRERATSHGSYEFTNGWLALYADNVAGRLRAK